VSHVFVGAPPTSELSEAWIEGDATARWRSASGHGADDGARASGSSVLEVEPGCRLPRHTDSAEETIVVVAGTAAVSVGEETADVPAGGVALVPECVPHEVRNAGSETLRFVAVYASTDVTTTYEDDVQPDGGRERDPIG
jgi:quercetin dioxygenase-like cupin family protein